MWSGRNALILLLIIAVGVAVRVVSLRHEALDGDEAFSYNVAVLPLHDALVKISNDLVHPPFHYLVLKAGVDLWGASALGIRIWSLLFGIATLILVVSIGGKLPGARYTGLLAAALLALNETHIFFSQQARSYAMYAFLVLLLVEWVARISREQRSPRLWVAGAALMIVLVYTHYVAAIYVLAAAIAVFASKLPARTKLLTFGIGALAALSFLPWLAIEAKVYKAKQGFGKHLEWQGHPHFYELKDIWASALGVMNFKGATTLVFLLAILLALAALKYIPKQSLLVSPAVVTLFSLAFIPPIVVFLLSVPPLDLPLFGLRHHLPSIVALVILCSYGLEVLALRFGENRARVFAIGSILLLGIAGVTCANGLAHLPARYPYDRIAHDVQANFAKGPEAFTTWPYGIGAPVNLYCGTRCVEPLPADESRLPSTFVLLYRPRAEQEMPYYKRLIRDGYSPISTPVYYTDGRHGIWGTSIVVMQRPGSVVAK